MMMERIFKSIYYNPSHPASFSTARKLYKASRLIDPNITLDEVEHWLLGENTYTLHKSAKRNFKRDRVFVREKDEQFQADLVDMQKFSKENNGFRYILTVIDCFSKYAFAIPVKNKTGLEVKRAFEKVFSIRKPYILQTDRGTEFLNPTVQNYLKSLEIKFFTTFNTKFKCSIVERFNRTLKSKMFKYFTANGTRKYINVLPKLLESYNNTYHRSIKTSPSKVNENNEKDVFFNLYGVTNEREYILRNRKISKLNSGDKVRMVYEFNPFDKGYYPNWTDTLYTIDKPIKGKYELKDPSGVTIKRRYYPEEIQKIRENLYRIEKIIKRETRNGIPGFIVKWLGYSSEHNSWIPVNALQNVGEN